MQLFFTGSPRKYSLASSRSRTKPNSAQKGTLDLSITNDRSKVRLATDKLEEERLPSAMSYRTHRTLSHFPGGMCTTLNVSQMVNSKRHPPKSPPKSSRCNVTLQLNIPQRLKPLMKASNHTTRMRTRERQRQSYNLHQPSRQRFLHMLQSTIEQKATQVNGLVEYFTSYGQEMATNRSQQYQPRKQEQSIPQRRVVRPMLASMLRERLKTQSRNRQKHEHDKKKQLSSERKLYLNKFLELL